MFQQYSLSACNLNADFKPTKNTYVCSRHFKRENFTTQTTGKIVLKCLTIPSIFPWNKSVAVTPKANNSPATSKPSSPPPIDIKVEDANDKKAIEESFIKIEPVAASVIKLEDAKTPGSVIKAPATPKESRKKTIGSAKKTSNFKIVLPKSADKPNKKSKRLSAKLASATKIKPTAIPKDLETTEKIKSEVVSVATPKKKNQLVNFVPGSSIEAQNFDLKWMPVKVIEVDMEEREVLVRSCDKTNKSKTG